MPTGIKNAKPSHLKVVQGTFRPDRAPSKEITPAPATWTTPPRGLDVHARRCWRQYAPMLLRLGLLTEADGQAFVLLCQTWARHERAQARLRAVYRQKPKVTIEAIEYIRKAEVSVEQASRELRQLWSEFGMTPAARSRLDVYAPPLETEVDEYERVFGSGTSS